MFRLKLVIIATLLFIVCAFALQGESDVADVVERNSNLEETKDQAERWRWHDDEDTYDDDHEGEKKDRKQVRKKSSDDSSSSSSDFSACTPPRSRPSSSGSGSSSSDSGSSAPAAPTPAPQAPTTEPPKAPTIVPIRVPTPTPSATSKSSSSSGSNNGGSNTGSTSGSTSGSSVGLCDVVPTSVEPLKLLVPLYVYPGSAWDQVVTAASKVGVIAIINPNSGPASSPDSSYTSYMNKLKSAGAEQIGYVYTSYGARAISAVKADIDTYANKYPGINGIFFDEASDNAKDVAYYGQLYQYVLSKGFKHSILNPGTQPDQGYVAISTSIVVFEDAGTSASKSYSSFVKCASNAAQKSGYKYKFAGIAHTTSLSNSASIISNFNNQGMGLVYVTDGAGGCCTYNNLVSYFSSEVSTVQSLNK